MQRKRGDLLMLCLQSCSVLDSSIRARQLFLAVYCTAPVRVQASVVRIGRESGLGAANGIVATDSSSLCSKANAQYLY